MPELVIEQAVEKLRSQDVIGAFEAHYRTKHAEDPVAWPISLTPSEWVQSFGEFLLEYSLGQD